jgi:hypothetical protein
LWLENWFQISRFEKGRNKSADDDDDDDDEVV